VAALAAESPTIAREALKLIDVQYEPLRRFSARKTLFRKGPLSSTKTNPATLRRVTSLNGAMWIKTSLRAIMCSKRNFLPPG